jgi:hypothetical protein
MRDFTLHIYRDLLKALKSAGYAFYTFEDWCDGKAEGRFVILRHDVDLKAENSFMTAEIEAAMGIRASYYFRVVPQSNQPDVIRAIASLGHEIGYHYEDFSLFKGDADKSIEHFKAQLLHFRQFYPVRTICMHGSPTSKWDNKDLWKTYNYRDFGIVGEPYFDLINNELAGQLTYLTDTARMWDGDKYNVRDKSIRKISPSVLVHSTLDVIKWLKSEPEDRVLMITTHPQRWTNSSLLWLKELILQSLKNGLKRLIVHK